MESSTADNPVALESTGRPAPVFWGWLDASQLRPTDSPIERRSLPSGGLQFVARGLDLCVAPGEARFVTLEDGVAIVSGRPFVAGGELPATDRSIGEILQRSEDAREAFSGRYSIVHIDWRRCRAWLLTDRFATYPLCYAHQGQRLAFSNRAESVPALGSPTIDPQALFNYTWFHVLPAPRTAFVGVRRLEPASRLSFRDGAVAIERTWRPRFASMGVRAEAPSADRFRALLLSSVEREAGAARTGAFLSGGTDSSTVVGMLRQVQGEPPTVFSIGFDVAGFDEIEYASIAARHFDCRHHIYYVTPTDVISAVPRIAGQYDQPFGNSSALPAYYCSLLAREHGMTSLLAGDGGDELFGGNTRYAKQKVFAAYESIPPAMRRQLLEPALLGGLRSVPGLRKAASYVAQARIPLPDRNDSYNLMLRHGIENLFSPRLLEAVTIDEPPRLQREVFAESEGAALVDRMLAFDWRFTLADNDLPKVIGTAAISDMRVAFPLLDDRLVDFSLLLSSREKVRGLTLRPWFKAALADFLPLQTLRKKKHGFGLPFGPWLISHPQLRRFASDSIEGLIARKVIVPSAMNRLFSGELERYPSYYGEMIWILMLAEQWFRRARPDWSLA